MMIKSYLKFHASKEQLISDLKSEFDLSEEEAVEYYEQYLKEH